MFFCYFTISRCALFVFHLYFFCTTNAKRWPKMKNNFHCCEKHILQGNNGLNNCIWGLNYTAPTTNSQVLNEFGIELWAILRADWPAIAFHKYFAFLFSNQKKIKQKEIFRVCYFFFNLATRLLFDCHMLLIYMNY